MLKRSIIVFCLFILCIIKPFAANSPFKADDILGHWLTEEGKAKVEIVRVGKQYFGKIILLKKPREEDGSIKLDKHNPDPKMRSKTIVGSNILRNFTYNEETGEYENGRIYDPESGKDYSCYMKFEDKNKLYLRGYIGFSMIGRTQYWTRSN